MFAVWTLGFSKVLDKKTIDEVRMLTGLHSESQYRPDRLACTIADKDAAAGYRPDPPESGPKLELPHPAVGRYVRLWGRRP